MTAINTALDTNITGTGIATSITIIDEDTATSKINTGKDIDPDTITDKSEVIQAIIGITNIVITTVIMFIGVMINTIIMAIRVILARAMIIISNTLPSI